MARKAKIVEEELFEDDDEVEVAPKRKRGRPPLSPEEKARRAAERAALKAAGATPAPAVKRRGRPPADPNAAAARDQTAELRMENKVLKRLLVQTLKSM